MSRIRTIKPEFWVNEQIMSCSPTSRLLFIGIWNFCDDAGIHPASLPRIKAEVFPADNCTITDIKKWINELIINGLLREYIVEEKSYWIVTGWRKHQRIDKPTYRHPLPESELKKIDDNSTTIRRNINDGTSRAPQPVDDSSPTEWKGMEGIGKEVNICEVETSPVDNSETNSFAGTHEIFKHWQTVMDHPKAKFDGKRQRLIKQALKLGYSVADLKQAIDGCKLTPYNMGKNEGRQIYDDINLIFRDADHIDRFVRNAAGTNIATADCAMDSLMAGGI